MTSSYESVLSPITDFKADELGPRLAELVESNRKLLIARYILGPLDRYCDVETAELSVMRAQEIHEDPDNTQQIFVPVGAEGNPEGVATIYPDLELKRLRLPIPLGLPDQSTIKWLRTKSGMLDTLVGKSWWDDLSNATPNLTVWTNANHEELLTIAYKELENMHYSGVRPWTIEPIRSPKYVHRAIRATSMKPIAERWFDDQESRRKVAPRSRLYARLQTEWITSYGKLKELREGKESWMERINKEYATRMATRAENTPKREN